MKKLVLAAAWIPLFAPYGGWAQELLHQAAPMIAPANKPLSREALSEQKRAPQRQETAEAILSKFDRAFGEQKPRMAVFWNRAFDDQVSDWYSTRRGVASQRGHLAGEVPDGNVELQWNSQSAVQSEYRAGSERSTLKPAFELQAGLVRQLKAAGVTVLDRASIMRLADNGLETGEFLRLSPDQRRLEMRALDQFADLLLVFRELSQDQFQLEVLDVHSGGIVAMLSSNGVPPGDESEYQWLATDEGFKRIYKDIPLDETGQELALQLLQNMADSES